MESITFVLCLLVLSAHALLVFGVDCNVDGHKFKAGEKYTPIGHCVEYECIDSNALSMIGCTVTATNKPCKKVKGDLSKPYPSCCSYFEDC